MSKDAIKSRGASVTSIPRPKLPTKATIYLVRKGCAHLVKKAAALRVRSWSTAEQAVSLCRKLTKKISRGEDLFRTFLSSLKLAADLTRSIQTKELASLELAKLRLVEQLDTFRSKERKRLGAERFGEKDVATTRWEWQPVVTDSSKVPDDYKEVRINWLRNAGRAAEKTPAGKPKLKVAGVKWEKREIYVFG